MEKTNRHHVYPTSRLNGTGLVGVCFEPLKQKRIYYELLDGEKDILETFNYLNEKFWGKSFIIDHIYKARKKTKIEMVILSHRKKRQSRRPQICKVSKKKHELYHQLFGNMIPEEVLWFLNRRFWKNKFVLEEKKINGFSIPIYSKKLALA